MMSGAVWAGNLTISSYISEAGPKATFQEVVDEFQKENPEIKVEVNTVDHEAFKTQIRSILTLPKGQAPDLVTWFASERMKYFARKGLLKDLGAFWDANNMQEKYPEAISQALKLDNIPYGITLAAYTWGLYYRKDILDKLGIVPPNTFDELIQTCRILREENYVPIALGSQYMWTIAGLFDVLNLRINGLDFHRDFTSGKVPFTDPRIKNTLKHLRIMSENRCFNDNHSALRWNAAAALLDVESKAPNQAVMSYIGMFIDFALNEETKSRMGLIRFPKIDPEMTNYEDIPTDTTYIIPKNSSNTKDAEAFLKFIVQPRIVSKLSTWQLPLIGSVPEDAPELIQQAQGILEGTSGSAEFLDRDMNPELASRFMEGLSKFMAKPDQMDDILKKMEAVRKCIIKK